MAACASSAGKDGDKAGAAASGGVVLSADAQPLGGFSYDTGLIPAGSPAQVQLKLSAGGGVHVEATGTPSDKGLEGEKGSGKVSVDLHVKLDGHLKVDSGFVNVDGDLPGVQNIDIAIKGDTTFDPFLVGKAQSAKLDAPIPATDLPDIPLGTTPGTLKLSVVDGSVLHSTFTGSCLSVSGEKAAYTGSLATTGSLVLKGTLAITGLPESVDLGTITIPIPDATTPLDFGSKPAAGAKDDESGAHCAAAKSASSSSTSDNTTPAPAAPPPPAPPTSIDTTTPATAQTDCSNDAHEPNNLAMQASDLGTMADNDDQTVTLNNLGMASTDEDWFVVSVVNKAYFSNPIIDAQTSDSALEVSIFHDCASGGNESTCSGGGDAQTDPLEGAGCTSILGSVSVQTECSGTDESGTAHIRIRSLDSACHAYALSVTVR